jgi:hypothetical protein
LQPPSRQHTFNKRKFFFLFSVPEYPQGPDFEEATGVRTSKGVVTEENISKHELRFFFCPGIKNSDVRRKAYLRLMPTNT